VSSRCRFVVLFVVAFAALSLQADAQTAPASALPPLTSGRTHEGTTTSTPGLTPSTSLCPPAGDPTYGTTAANPIEVGGAPLYIADRSVKFMRMLRGPAGEPVHFKRLGSFEGPEATILDVWLVERAGASQHLCLDGYRSSELQAPAGWLCGGEPRVASVSTGTSSARRQFSDVAAATFGLSATPISIDADGSAAHGVIFDYARLVGREAARASASGTLLDPGGPPEPLATPRFVVVAYPIACAGRDPIRAQSIKVTDVNGQSPRVLREAGGVEVRELVAGFDAPDGSLAVAYDANLAIPGQLEIVYNESCGTAGVSVRFPMRGEAGRITTRIAGEAPAGFALPPGGMQVRVQVYFDHTGEPKLPTFAGGDSTLAEAAIAAARQFRAQPPTINGALLLQPSTIMVAFTH